VADRDKTLTGLVDLRDLVTAQPETSLSELMIAPVVTADRDALREDLGELFIKYRFHMLPVVDVHDHLLGVVRYKDLMKDAKIELPT
jgi:magnesium transporter